MALDRFDPRLRERFLDCETVDNVIRVAKDAGLHLGDAEVIAIAIMVRKITSPEEKRAGALQRCQGPRMA